MKTILQQNKDLDLRRYGKDVFTKASNSGSEGSVDEQAIITEAFNSILITIYEGDFIYPDAFIFFDTELQEYKVLDTVEALIWTGMQGITPAYKAQPTAENTYFRGTGDNFAPATLDGYDVREATINEVTYYYLDAKSS